MGWWTTRSADAPRGREREVLRQEVARLASVAETPRILTALGRLHEWLDDSGTAAATYGRALALCLDHGAPRWQQLQLEARIAACGEVSPPEATLEIRHAGRVVRVPARACVLGRGSRTADVIIPSSTVAHAHCALWRQGGVWHVRDLGSTHGTRLEGSELIGTATLDGETELELAQERVVVKIL